MAHGPRMNVGLLDFGDNPNQVTLGLQLPVRLTYLVTPGRTVSPLGEDRVISRNTGLVLPVVSLFNSN